MEQILGLFKNTQMQWIVILIAIDVVLGIAAAFMKKEFRLGKLAGFMKRGVLKYVLGFALLEMTAAALPSLAFVTAGAFVLVVLALVGSILNNLGKLGLPIPGLLKN